jgi:hypothetical protein
MMMGNVSEALLFYTINDGKLLFYTKSQWVSCRGGPQESTILSHLNISIKEQHVAWRHH